MKQRVFSVLVENTSGVLSHMSGLFSRRGYNIDSFSAGVTSDPRFTRCTIVASGDELILEQIEKQLNKLEDVIKVTVLKNGESVTRELMLVKVHSPKPQFELSELVDRFHAKEVDVDYAHESVVIEVTGTHGKLDSFLENLESCNFEILELARTGITGLTRGTKDLVLVNEDGEISRTL